MSIEASRMLLPLFEELQGERVVIRPYRESDAQVLFEAVAESRDHLRPWQPWIADTHQTSKESHDLVANWAAQWARREQLIVGIWDRITGDYPGSCGSYLITTSSTHIGRQQWRVKQIKQEGICCSCHHPMDIGNRLP
ncbi:MAG TPA: hypothetical protein VGN34_16085 [Ktedonobacteraceae bacterium]